MHAYLFTCMNVTHLNVYWHSQMECRRSPHHPCCILKAMKSKRSHFGQIWLAATQTRKMPRGSVCEISAPLYLFCLVFFFFLLIVDSHFMVLDKCWESDKRWNFASISDHLPLPPTQAKSKLCFIYKIDTLITVLLKTGVLTDPWAAVPCFCKR